MQLSKSIKIQTVSENENKISYRILLMLILSGILVMGYFIFLAVNHGSLAIEGPNLVDMPWGFLSLIDIYTGLILISYWIVWREKNFFRSSPWIILLMVLGNMGTCMYLLKCLIESRGEPTIFFQGNR